MYKGLVKKYLVWLALLVATMIIPLFLLLTASKDVAGSDRLISTIAFFGVSFSCGALVMVVLMAKLMAYPWKEKIPRWISVIVVYSVIGFFIAPYIGAYADYVWKQEQQKYEVYFLLAGLVIFAANVIVVFFVQSWLVTSKLQIKWPLALLINWVFAMWMLESLVFPTDSLFIEVSAFVTLALVPAAMLVEMLLFYRRFRSTVKRLQDIYS